MSLTNLKIKYLYSNVKWKYNEVNSPSFQWRAFRNTHSLVLLSTFTINSSLVANWESRKSEKVVGLQQRAELRQPIKINRKLNVNCWWIRLLKPFHYLCSFLVTHFRCFLCNSNFPDRISLNVGKLLFLLTRSFDILAGLHKMVDL